MNKTVLVLGATGAIGGEVARQLRDAGWTVRALQRRAGKTSEERERITWLKGDALNPEDVASAAEGCSVIVHAVNPQGYRNWDSTAVPMLDNTLAAARKNKATVVFPGNIYNYGPDAFPLLTEESPQHPHTRLGAIRVKMEARLRDYAEAGKDVEGARVIIVRAGDFFGTGAANSWFSQGLIRPGHRVTRVRNPGQGGVGHQWSYLPDVARTMVLLLERRESLEPFASFHMGGHWDATGTQMVESICRVVAKRSGEQPKVTGFPWRLIRMMAPLMESMRGLIEMRYLWQQPVQMDNRKLISVLGQEPHTPLEQAVEETLRGLKCLV